MLVRLFHRFFNVATHNEGDGRNARHYIYKRRLTMQSLSRSTRLISLAHQAPEARAVRPRYAADVRSVTDGIVREVIIGKPRPNPNLEH
jgi:hypothetical protein